MKEELEIGNGEVLTVIATTEESVEYMPGIDIFVRCNETTSAETRLPTKAEWHAHTAFITDAIERLLQ